MTREQAINYLFSSGFTNEQVSDVVRALTYEPITKNDLGVDCISRQATINAVKRIHPVDTDYDCTLYDKVDVMYVLDEMPSVTPQEPRWISVSERLPEIHNYCDKYLVTLERGWVRTASFTECDGNHWWSYDDVVAWMPLPQPYSEVEE